jgi:tRNA pseudouridine38-40 synthase
LRNIKLIIAYDGTDFSGWQRQPSAPTVQACVEGAIGRITGFNSTTCASGRTDSGVHAEAQVAHFKTDCPIPCPNLVKALNDALPPTVRIISASDAALDFHARYGAKSKVYRYQILQSPVCPPFLCRFVYHYPYPLDRRAMAKAARLFEGEHDFTSFAAAGEEQKPEARSKKPEEGIQSSEFRIVNAETKGTVRTIFASRITRRQKSSMLCYDVRGSGFLHHMVRNIVGTLLEVGRGKLAPEDILHILNARDRTAAGPTAPPQGLCLMKVEY